MDTSASLPPPHYSLLSFTTAYRVKRNQIPVLELGIKLLQFLNPPNVDRSKGDQALYKTKNAPTTAIILRQARSENKIITS